MKFTMPILAAVVALLFIASQSVYTVDQRKYAVKFQLGEVVETTNVAGLYFKLPLVQRVKMLCDLKVRFFKAGRPVSAADAMK